MTAEIVVKSQEAQRWNARAVAAMKPGGNTSRAIRDVIVQLQRAEIGITHVDTGALKASIRVEFNGGLRGKTFIDPAAVNPKHGKKVTSYAGVENARDGDHAFAERTVRDYAPAIINRALAQIGRGLV